MRVPVFSISHLWEFWHCETVSVIYHWPIVLHCILCYFQTKLKTSSSTEGFGDACECHQHQFCVVSG